MRSKRTYRIQILEKDREDATVLPLYPTGDVLTITRGQIDAGEFDPIKASEVVLSLLCLDNNESLMSLFTTDPLRYMVRIQYLSFLRYVPLWEGYLVAGTYTQDYALPPYRVEMRATDGLALLKDMPYLNADGKRYTGVRSLYDMIIDIIGRISTRNVVFSYKWDNIEPAQSVDTSTIVGIESEGVYSVLGGNDVPSCYDVLEAILTSMQCQLFQGYGQWRIRPLSGLLTAKPAKTTSLIVNNGGNYVSLYSDNDDGAGMSTTATLSLLPPYKELKIERPETVEEEDALPSLLLPSRWTPIWKTKRSSLLAIGKDATRLAVYDSASEDQAYGVAYVFDGLLNRTAGTSITVSLDAYNLSIKAGTFQAGFLLVAEGSDPLNSWNINDLENVDDVAVWYNDRWVKLSNLQEAMELDEFGPVSVVTAMSKIELEASRRNVLFNIPVPVKQLTATSIDITATNIDSDIAERYKLVMVLGSKSGVPEIELRNPTMSVEQSVNIEPVVRFNEGSISLTGLGDISYKQAFADTWMLPAVGHTFEAPLIDMRSGAMLRGILQPSQRQMLADAALTSMKALRGGTSRQLSGDVYAKTFIDLDAIFQERNGRKYYTNYVRHNLRREVDNVQLREIRSSGRVYATWFDSEITNVVGMDSSAMWLSSNSRTLHRLDLQKDVLEEVMSSSSDAPLTLNEGQCCASVISYDGVFYTLTAYNTHGEVLSKIEQAQLLVQVFDAALTDIVMRSARYDANINTWTLIGGNENVTYIQILSGDGYNVSSDVYSITGYTNAFNQVLLPNGYAFSVKKTGQALYTTYWHGFAHHIAGAIQRYGDYQRIVACNEVYLLIENSNKATYELYFRTDTAMGHAEAPLYSVSSSYYNFVAMNNALVVFRRKNANGAEVYDGRSGNVVSLGALDASADSILWLSGDKLYSAYTDSYGDYRFKHKTIENGAGASPSIVTEIE